MKLPSLRIDSKKFSLPIRKLPQVRKFSQAFKENKTKTAWGLDIGGYALKAVKIAQVSGCLQVEDFDVIEYSTVPPNGDLLQSTHIQEAVQTFLAKHRITRSDTILVSIPGHFILSRFISIPPVDRKQVKDIVNYEAKQQIPFDFKDIIWDYQQLSDISPDMESMEIGLFASKRTTLDYILTNIASLKPRINALQVTPLAIYNLALFDQHIGGATIIIHGETENTDLIIVDNLRLWLRSVSFSTINTDLVKEIQRSMEYYKSLTKDTVCFKTLLLTGSKFKDPLNINFIADNFKYEVKVLNVLNNLKVSDTINPAYFTENLVNLNTALGLALQGLKLGRIQINLLPPELIKAVEISKKKPYAAASIGCFALSLIVQYCGLHMQINHLNNSQSYHQKILQNIKGLEGRYKDVEAQAQTSKSALDLISSLDSSRFFWMEVLDTLLALIPDNVSVTSIQSSWIDADTVKIGNSEKQASSAFFQTKKINAPVKSAITQKLLLMDIKGESRDPSVGFIEEHILKPLQGVTLFDQKVPAFKNVEIVPGSCRQTEHKDGREGYISFEIRWIIKSYHEIQLETENLLAVPGTSTSSERS
ncbi:MAG: Type IV pilus biogenesis protein PilM [Candidatus Jettenia ecosi]|uniref:Type IV pilus biogenesis protein PilM n=1 Tax=Candidatus Jettenia ecosi TaxID=2494326 RepID=A0A533QBZ7_9BACT|nr:MAG: Type IV pilus biogenesis protein PilM [Candidatus Jettenia ecosi]